MSNLPRKWIEVPLGSLGAWRGGGTPSKTNYSWWKDGTIPWVSPKDMKSDFIRGSLDKITSKAVEEGAAELVPPGSLLFVTRSGILAHSTPTAITEVEAATNQDIKALVPAPGVNVGFLSAQIRARSGELLAHARKAGTTVESLVFQRLQSFPIRLAPLRQQERIAGDLERIRFRVQSAASAFNDVAKTVAALREMLADRFVGGELTASGRHMPPTITRSRLQDLLIEPGRTGLSIKGRLDPPGVRALKLSALRRPVVDMTDVRYLPIDQERASRLLLRAGDVLISRGSGTKTLVGRASLVQKVVEPTIFPDTSYRLRLDPELVMPEWFVAVWNAPITRRGFESRIRTTAGIWKVGWKDLSDLLIAVPSLAEQADALEALRAASGRLDLALAKVDRGARAIEQYEQLMLSRAFEGRLVSALDSDEDAAFIVARAKQMPAPPKIKQRRSKMPSPREAFREMVEQWPEAGRSFQELRELVSGRYDDLKDVVFEAIEEGVIRQSFDIERREMILLKCAS